MTSTGEYLEKLIDDCGGLSRFQWILIAIILGCKLCVTWSMLMMTFAGAIPDWNCIYNATNTTSYINQTTTQGHLLKKCHPVDADVTKCDRYSFGGEMNTIISEWTLVCDKDWIPATVTTIQMAGLLASGFTVGQMADYFGRKPLFFTSLFLLTGLNIIAGFSVSWQMFAVLRFLIGYGCGCYLIVYYNFISEFVPKQHRPIVLAIPSWPIWAAVFGLVSMVLHDWRYLHFATAICTIPFLLTWRLIPESFRWLISHKKIDQATDVIHTIASWNRKPVPDLGKLPMIVEELNAEKSKVFTMKDLFSTPALIKVTLLLSVGWLSCGYTYYAISFGVQSLSGNLYLNMFLLSLVEFPASIIVYFGSNRLGRRPSALFMCFVAAVAGLAVGGIQISDIKNKSSLVNGLALTSKMGVSGGWAAIMVMTTESYPTVIRNIGYGLHNTFARTGAMVAPQIVFLCLRHRTVDNDKRRLWKGSNSKSKFSDIIPLEKVACWYSARCQNDKVPGMLYFICGAAMFITCLCTAFIPETKGKAMPDTITIGVKSNKKDEKNGELKISTVSNLKDDSFVFTKL